MASRPPQLALAFCYHQPQGGQHHHRRDQPAQLDACLDAWSVQLNELLKAIDACAGTPRSGAVMAKDKSNSHISETPPLHG